MWPISEGTNEDDENNTDVEFEENLEDDLTGASRQEVESVVGAICCGGFNELQGESLEKLIDPTGGGGTHEEESQVKVCQTCPSEDQLDRVVNELEL